MSIAVGECAAIIDSDTELLCMLLVEDCAAPAVAGASLVAVSQRSMLGRALHGASAGELVVVRADSGSRTVEVLAVGRENLAAAQSAWSAERDGNGAGAASLLEAIGNYGSAARRYFAASMPADAGRCLARNRDPAGAAAAYAAAGDLLSEAEYWKVCRDWPAAASAFERANRPADSARMFERAEHWEQAARLYRSANDLSALGRCLDRLGDHGAAAEAYAAAGEWLRAAACEDLAGNTVGAAKAREAAEQLRLAARSYEKAGESESAANAYAGGGDPSNAARCFESAGLLERAAEMFDMAEHPDDALRCRGLDCESRGEYARAADLLDLAAEAAWWSGTGHELAARAKDCRNLAALQRASRPEG